MTPGTQNGTETNGTATRRVTVDSSAGLHARPASVLAANARGFTAEIALVLIASAGDHGMEPGTRVDAKSVLDVIVLGAAQGTTLDIEASGEDAEDAVTALAALFEDQFGM